MKFNDPHRYAAKLSGTCEIAAEAYERLGLDEVTFVVRAKLNGEGTSRAGTWTGNFAVEDLRMVAAQDAKEQIHQLAGLTIPDRPLFDTDASGAQVADDLEMGSDLEDEDDDLTLGDAIDELEQVEDEPVVEPVEDEVEEVEVNTTTYEEPVATPPDHDFEKAPTRDPVLLSFLQGRDQ